LSYVVGYLLPRRGAVGNTKHPVVLYLAFAFGAGKLLAKQLVVASLRTLARVAVGEEWADFSSSNQIRIGY
jgi:hypothetical protein